mmetsp:Transcript_116967/g.330977  ORF Transcript_116967/g.330977 Transcript_116967/m.330977 type:complete len:208 (-) Transcript_116967:1433-2056(-)
MDRLPCDDAEGPDVTFRHEHLVLDPEELGRHVRDCSQNLGSKGPPTSVLRQTEVPYFGDKSELVALRSRKQHVAASQITMDDSTTVNESHGVRNVMQRSKHCNHIWWRGKLTLHSQEAAFRTAGTCAQVTQFLDQPQNVELIPAGHVGRGCITQDFDQAWMVQSAAQLHFPDLCCDRLMFTLPAVDHFQRNRAPIGIDSTKNLAKTA